MKLFQKKDGIATIPILGSLIIFMFLLIVIYISYQESQRLCFKTEDAVIISIQGSCLFDRYEYATGSANNKEVVCFYAGIEGMRYKDDNAYNMELTKKACSYAYEIYKEILVSNIETNYVILPSVAEGGIANYVKKFEMTNVYKGIAYQYDIISGRTNIIVPATNLKSTIAVTMEMDMKFPLFGEKTVKIEKIGKLENRIN